MRDVNKDTKEQTRLTVLINYAVHNGQILLQQTIPIIHQSVRILISGYYTSQSFAISIHNIIPV